MEGTGRRLKTTCPFLFLFACLLPSTSCLLLTSGCVRQQLTVRSEPPGAEVFLNDARAGITPYVGGFLWYGQYRISLIKEGYERLDDRTLLRAPFYLWIPLDLVMELLPFPIRDTKALSYTLVPKTPLPEPIPPVTQSPVAEQSAPTHTGDRQPPDEQPGAPSETGP